MLFLASKLLGFLLEPVTWLVGILVWAAVTRSDRRRRRLSLLALALVVLLTNPLLLDVARDAWTVEPVPMDALDGSFDYAIVLGGFANAGAEPRDRLHLNGAASRLTHAIELYRAGRVDKLLISGGSSRIVGDKALEAEETARFLRRLEIPDDDVVVESSSRNTHENAVGTARVLAQRHPNESARCLLVTDGLHMRRALGCFRKTGVDVVPFATGASRRAGRAWTPDRWLLPTTAGFGGWAGLVREVAGTAVYRAAGYL